MCVSFPTWAAACSPRGGGGRAPEPGGMAWEGEEEEGGRAAGPGGRGPGPGRPPPTREDRAPTS